MPKQNYHIDINTTLGWWGFTKHDAARGLAGAPKGELHVRVSSLGGSLADGLDIRRQFADHGDVTVHIVGMTASAATVLAMGAKRILMSRGASMLIHNCSLFVDSWGSKNKEEVAEEVEKLKAVHGDLATLDSVMADIYAARTGKSVEEMAALMTENRWITAAEALEIGLIDEIEDDFAKATKEDRASALEAIAALGMPDIVESVTEEPQDDTPSLLRSICTAVQDLGRQMAAAFTTSEPETQKNIIMNKTTHPGLMAALSVEELTATAEGAVSLTKEQLTALNERLAALDAEKNDLTEKLTAAETEKTNLTARIEALEKADGDDDKGKPAPEAKEEMSVQALAKLI